MRESLPRCISGVCGGRSGRPEEPAIITRGKPQTFTHAAFPTTARGGASLLALIHDEAERNPKRLA